MSRLARDAAFNVGPVRYRVPRSGSSLVHRVEEQRAVSSRTDRVGAKATMCVTRAMAAVLLMASGAFAQTPNDPFPSPIHTVDGVIEVSFVEFATVPDIGGEAARMMLLVDEPGTGRMFVSDMRGPLYSVSYDGRTVSQYLDINAEHWGVNVESPRRGWASRALRSIRSSINLAPLASVSCTPGLTPPTQPRHPTSSPAAAMIRTTRSCSSGPPRLPPR